jgi:hypothetical protein
MLDADTQTFIIGQVGDVDNYLVGQMPGIWTATADYANVPMLRLYMAWGFAIQGMIGHLRPQVDFAVAGDVQVRLYQQIQGLQAQAAWVEAQIATARSNAAAGVAPLAGLLTTTTPLPSPLYGADASDPLYTGDARQAIWWVQAP